MSKKTTSVLAGILFLMIGIVLWHFLFRTISLSSSEAVVVGPGVIVYAPLSGNIKEIMVRPGQEIAQNSVLFSMDKMELEAELAQAKVNLSALAIGLPEDRRKEARRSLGLPASEASSQNTENSLKRAMEEEENSKADLKKASEKQAKARLANLRMRDNPQISQKEKAKAALADREATLDLENANKKQEAASTVRANFEKQFNSQHSVAQQLAENPMQLEARTQNYKQQLAFVAQAENNLMLADIRAPFKGHVTQIMIAQGSAVDSGQKALFIEPSDTKFMWIEAFYPQKYADVINAGQKSYIFLEVSPTLSLPGVVLGITAAKEAKSIIPQKESEPTQKDALRSSDSVAITAESVKDNARYTAQVPEKTNKLDNKSSSFEKSEMIMVRIAFAEQNGELEKLPDLRPGLKGKVKIFPEEYVQLPKN